MLSEAQRRALEQAIADGGSLVFGGVDGRKIRVDVLARLQEKGYVTFGGGGLHHTEWDITPAGRAALKGD